MMRRRELLLGSAFLSVAAALGADVASACR